MQINLSGHHVEITPALRNITNEKFSRLERYADRITSVHVTLSVEKTRKMAEANIHIAGAEIHAHAESDDMYGAIDAMIAKLDRQLQKHKEKEGHR